MENLIDISIFDPEKVKIARNAYVLASKSMNEAFSSIWKNNNKFKEICAGMILQDYYYNDENTKVYCNKENGGYDLFSYKNGELLDKIEHKSRTIKNPKNILSGCIIFDKIFDNEKKEDIKNTDLFIVEANNCYDETFSYIVGRNNTELKEFLEDKFIIHLERQSKRREEGKKCFYGCSVNVKNFASLLTEKRIFAIRDFLRMEEILND